MYYKLRKPGTAIQIPNMKYAIWNYKYVFGIPNTYLEFQIAYFKLLIWMVVPGFRNKLCLELLRIKQILQYNRELIFSNIDLVA